METTLGEENFMSQKFSIFLFLLVLQFHRLDSMCPSGFLLPDCSQSCPQGFFGLNCSSSCPGTCSNYSCAPTTGDCLSCHPGFTGAKCTGRCPLGSYGQDCDQKCPHRCAKNTCDPFTGLCQHCVRGFLGKRCDHPAPGFDANGKQIANLEPGTGAIDLEPDKNDLLVISLAISALVIFPICLVILIGPKVTKKIRRVKSRLRTRTPREMPSVQSSRTSGLFSLSAFENSSQRQTLANNSFGNVSEKLPLTARLRQLYNHFGSLVDKSSDLQSSLPARGLSRKFRRRPIYRPKEDQSQRQRDIISSSFATSLSYDTESFQKMRITSHATEGRSLKIPTNFGVSFQDRSDTIFLSTSPVCLEKGPKDQQLLYSNVLQSSSLATGSSNDNQFSPRKDSDNTLFFKTVPIASHEPMNLSHSAISLDRLPVMERACSGIMADAADREISKRARSQKILSSYGNVNSRKDQRRHKQGVSKVKSIGRTLSDSGIHMSPLKTSPGMKTQLSQLSPRQPATSTTTTTYQRQEAKTSQGARPSCMPEY